MPSPAVTRHCHLQSWSIDTSQDTLRYGAQVKPRQATLFKDQLSRLSPFAGFEEVSGAGLASALQRRQGVEGFLDIHTSTGLGVTHVLGPTTPLDRTNLNSNSMQRHSKPTRNACQLVSIETGQSMALGLDITRDLQGEYAYIQVSLLSGTCSAHSTLKALCLSTPP